MPECKASPSAWISLLALGLAACYSPEIPEETQGNALSPGAQPGTDVRQVSTEQHSVKGSLTKPEPTPPGSGGTQTELTPPTEQEPVPRPPSPPDPPLHPTPPSAVPTCEPQLAVPAVLPAACAGEAYFARLRLQCAAGAAEAPAVQWRPEVLPNGLTLTADGQLLGGSELLAGTYALRARALVGDAELPVTLQLDVLDRCWVFLAAREAGADGSAGSSRILAQRLDGAGGSLWLPDGLAAESSVTSFDRSADGRFLAAVSASASGERALHLFRVTGGRVEELPLQHAGLHVAHAFSPDSARLAVVTDLNRDPNAAQATRASVLELNALDPAAPAQLLPEAFAVNYQMGLGWADAVTLEFIGLSPLLQTLFTPQVVRLPEAGLAAAELTEVLYPLDPADTLRWFRPLADGLFVMTNALLYINASATVSALHLDAQVLSPTYDFSAHAAQGSLLLHAPETDDLSPPSFEAAGCDRMLAWSGDGRTLACVFEGKLVSFALTPGGLVPERLEIAWSAAGAERSLLSQQGNWLALADREHGLFLWSRGSPPPARPLLAAGPGQGNWDFGISQDERQLWVQQGHELSLATLLAGTEPQFTLLSTELPDPAPCVASGMPLPAAWCGAPELQNHIALRRAGRYLAFAEASGALVIVDMAVPERRLQPSAQLSGDCPESCIQFQ